MSTPNRTLSKGTLGLKFMNKVQPIPLISKPISTNNDDTTSTNPKSTSTASKVKVESSQSIKAVVIKVDDVKMEGIEEDSTPIASTSGQRRIIQESSLLSFPLLSASSYSSTSKFTSSTSSYSSMPWTNSVISGRRSFGGANIEIEQLNNPSLPSTTTTPAKDVEETYSQKKKRKSKESDERTVDPRRDFSNIDLNSRKMDTSFQSNSDEIKLSGQGSDKKQRNNNSQSNSSSNKKDYPQPPSLSKGKFAKPAGFEGAKKSNGKGKGNQQQVDEEPVWGERGSERAWDVGKNEQDSDDSEDDDSSSDDEEELRIVSRLLDGKKVNSNNSTQQSSQQSTSSSKKVKKEKFEKEMNEMFKQEGGSGSKERELQVDEAIHNAERSWDIDEKETNGKKNKKNKKQKNREK